MNKRLSFILSIIFVLPFIFILSACGSNSSNNHTHNYELIVTAPTCSCEGYTTHICSCGESYVDTYTSALGHNFLTYIPDGNASTETDGTKTAHCENNNCSDTDTIIDVDSKFRCEYSLGLEYVPYKNGYAISGKGSCQDSIIIIPNIYNGLPVIAITQYSFSSDNSIEAIKIPNSIISIGTYAFHFCNNLTIYCEVENQQSGWDNSWNSSDRPVIWNVKKIGSNENYRYTIFQDNTVAINKYLNNQTEVEIPKEIESLPVTQIYGYAFYNCSNLRNVTFESPSNMLNISGYAFNKCNLKSIIIPLSVQSIGNYAFSSNNNFIIYCEVKDKPSNWNTSWNYSSLRVIWNIKKVGINENYKYIIFQDNTATISEYLGNATEVEIPKEIESYPITQIYQYAFYDCDNLRNVTFENNSNILSINDNAFAYCNNLKSVILPSSIQNIESRAFYECSNLIDIIIPNNVKNIGFMSFAECEDLTIYCELESKPNGWNENWNDLNNKVYWYSSSSPIISEKYWHYVNGKPVIW